MRTVETHLYRVPGIGKRRSYVGPVHLTHEEALARYGPDAKPEPGTMRMRQEFDPDEVRRTMQSAGMDGARGG